MLIPKKRIRSRSRGTFRKSVSLITKACYDGYLDLRRDGKSCNSCKYTEYCWFCGLKQ